MIRPILLHPDPRLKKLCDPVAQATEDLVKLARDMLDTMYDAPGIGLAAIQVGVAKRVLVIDLQERDEESGAVIREPRVFINPEIVEMSEDLTVYSEGCLSVPDQYADVERPSIIKAKWLDENGKAHEEVIDGLLAICLQHEMDHLNGILFIDHLSKLKRDMVLKKLAKARKMAA